MPFCVTMRSGQRSATTTNQYSTVIGTPHKRFSGENMSPFIRARASEPEHETWSHEFVAFIDELNEAFLENPAL